MVQSENILKVENLYVSYDNVNIVRNISFDLKKQEFLGIVGESGCGKTTLLRALMMLKRRGNSMKGRLLFQGGGAENSPGRGHLNDSPECVCGDG